MRNPSQRAGHQINLFRHVALVAIKSRENGITLGARIHGAFGPFIPVGIRIGLHAVEKLKADPRGLIVIYYNGTKPHCPCVADGIMIFCSSPVRAKAHSESRPIRRLTVQWPLPSSRTARPAKGCTTRLPKNGCRKSGWIRLDPIHRRGTILP